jgi:hypothetical protein
MADQLPTSDVGTRVFSGARARFFFNGTQVAYASGCDGSEEITYEPVDVLDNIAVQEHVPTGYRVSFNCNIFRTVASGASTDVAPGSLKEQGIFPKFGTRGETILQMTGVVVFIQDRNTNKVLYVIEGVKPASHNFSINARGVVAQNVSFVATHMKDEADIAAA